MLYHVLFISSPNSVLFECPLIDNGAWKSRIGHWSWNVPGSCGNLPEGGREEGGGLPYWLTPLVRWVLIKHNKISNKFKSFEKCTIIKFINPTPLLRMTRSSSYGRCPSRQTEISTKWTTYRYKREDRKKCILLICLYYLSITTLFR